MARKKKLKSRKVQPIKTTVVTTKENKRTLPAYCRMIQAVLADLNNPKGVPSQEIFQFVVAKYSLVKRTVKPKLSVALSNGVKRGIFIKIKSAGTDDVYGLKKRARNQHIPKAKKSAAQPRVKESYSSPEIETASQRLSETKTPKFSEMVEAAIANLKQRNGSSRENILKYLLSNYIINEKTLKRSLSTTLKTGIKKGSFVKVLGSGGNESYKLARKRHEAKTHKPQTKTSIRRKGKRLTLSAGKRVSENISVKKSHISKSKSSKRATTDSKHATVESNPHTETADLQQGPRKNSSEYHASRLSEVTITHQESIFVKIPSDDQQCQIVGVDITPDGRIVLVDGFNKRLKIFDRDRNCLSFYTFQESKYGPVAVSVLDNNEVIVSRYTLESFETHLHIIDIKGAELAIKHTIPLFGHLIRGLATYQDKIFISGSSLRSFEPPFVRLINRDGQTLWSTPLIYKYVLPDYLSCFSINNRLTVIMTDPNNHKIMELNGDTGCIEKERVVQKSGFRGTTFGKGIIYVCKCGSNEISAFDTNLDSNKTLLPTDWSSMRSALHPVSIQYDELRSQLMVSKLHFGEAANYVECFNVGPKQ